MLPKTAGRLDAAIWMMHASVILVLACVSGLASAAQEVVFAVVVHRHGDRRCVGGCSSRAGRGPCVPPPLLSASKPTPHVCGANRVVTTTTCVCCVPWAICSPVDCFPNDVDPDCTYWTVSGQLAVPVLGWSACVLNGPRPPCVSISCPHPHPPPTPTHPPPPPTRATVTTL
jgi:hypothetical protein